MSQVVTQLIVDASGAKSGVADFETAMAKAKAAAIDGGNATATSFESAQRRWVNALGATDPVVKAQIAMQQAMERQQTTGNKAVELGITTQAAAAAQLDKVRQAYQQHVDAAAKAGASATVFDKALSGVSGQLIALSAGAGPVGVFLSALGPWGVVASVGIGILTMAFEEAKRTAHLLADEAVNLEKFKEITGLSTDALQALTQAAAKHGVSAEEAVGAVVKFTSAWAEARDGSGAFLASLQKIDPVLADQIQRTKDSSVALEILAQAIQKADAAGDLARRNQLARAAGGRGGVTGLVGISASIGDAGGIAQLTQGYKDAGTVIGGDLLKSVEKLKSELDETTKRADLLQGAIGAKPVLEWELGWQKLRLEIARAGAELAGAEKNKPFWEWLFDKMGQASLDEAGIAMNMSAISAFSARGAANMGIPLPDYPPKLNMAGLEGQQPQAAAAAPKTLAAQLTDEKERITLLGTAATATDHLTLKTLEINAALSAHSTAINKDAAALGLRAAQLDADIEKQALHNSAMGAAAAIDDVVAARTDVLRKQQMQGAGLTPAEIDNQIRLTRERALGTAAIIAQTDSSRIEAATIGMSLQAATAYRIEQERIAQANRDGQKLKEWQIANLQKEAQAAGIAADALERKKLASDMKFDRNTLGLSDIDLQIATKLRGIYGDDIPAALNSSEAGFMRLTAQMKEMRTLADGFGQALLQNLAQGKSLTDSLAASMNSLGSAVASKAMSTGVAGLFGGAGGAGSTGGLDISSMLNQFKTMASAMSSAINDAMSSAAKSMGQATAGGGESPASAVTGGGGSFGAIGNIAVAIGISLLQGEAAKLKQAQADFKAAQDTWAKMAGEVAHFTASLTGNAGGSFTSALDDAKKKAQDYADAAHKAGQSADEINKALTIFADNLVRDFIGAFDVMNEALSQGLGSNSPAVKAQQNVKQIGDSLKAFIVDTQNAVNLTSAGGARSAAAAPDASGMMGLLGAITSELRGSAGGSTAGAAVVSSAVEHATASAQKYALSLLQTPPVLSDVSTKLLTLRGTAAQLQSTLQDLGMSAGAAAAAISSGVTRALDQMKADFTTGLTAKINSASGKGFINDINSLITESLGMLTDAKNLGTDPKQVAVYFQDQAQSIVDSAGLVGSSFDDLVKVFPELSGVVGQSRTALTQFQNTISDFLNSLQTGNLSALSPQDKVAAARSTYQSTLTAAQGGDQAAMGKLTQSASDFLTQAKDYYASSADYAAIFLQVNRDLGSVASASKTTNQLLGSVAQNSGTSVLHLASVDTSTDQTATATDATASATDQAAQTLQILQGLQDTTKSASVDISASVAQLGAQSQDIAGTQSSQYFGPMVSYLSQIANNTLIQGQAAAPPPSAFEWWNPFTWFADGGKVTGGTPGRDSVLGMLTPGEIVMNEQISRQFEPLLLAMNSGHLPRFADGGMVGAIGGAPSLPALAFAGPTWSAGANDNRAHFEYLAKEFRSTIRDLARANSASMGALAERLERLEAAQYAGAKQISDTQRVTAGRQARPGTKVA